MKKKEFFFESRDNHTKIHAVRWIPECDSIKGIFVIVHGMAEYIERYDEFATYFADRGYIVTGIDNLGHGKSMREDKNPGYFAKQDPATVAVRDVHRLKKLTQEEYPGLPVAIFGHSMGSFIVRNYIIRYGSGVECAVVAGTGMQPTGVIYGAKALAAVIKLFLGDNHVSKILEKCAFGGYFKRIPNPQTKNDWLSLDQENVAKYCADPLCGFTFTVNGDRTVLELLNRAQKAENIEKIPKELPILVTSGAEDPVGLYGKGPQSVYDAYKAAGIKDVSIKLYDDLRHEILNEACKEEVMADIYAFVDAHTCK